MRIALIGPTHPYRGGGAQHTTTLAHRLVAAGHDVVLESWSAQYPTLLYPGETNTGEPEGEPFPATCRELSWRRPDGWLRVGRRVGRTSDAVVCAVFTPVQVPAYLGILRGVRVGRARAVALCHNVLPHEPHFYDRPLMRTLLRHVDATLVHTDEQAALARALAAATPVHVAALPPHLPVSGRRPAGPVEARRRLLFFGIVRPYKGLDVLLRALAAGPPDVRLTVAGEFWGGVDPVRALVDDLGLTGRVDLRAGYVPAAEVPALFTDVDALVLPYRSATASQNVWLGFEHGVPVIATRVGSLAAQVRDGVDGLLCAPDDVADLAAAIDRLYAPGMLARLRAGVTAVDPDPYWKTYVETLAEAARP